MSQVVHARCPGCKRTLRIPEDWVKRAIRCKHCGAVLQARSAQAPQALTGQEQSPQVKPAVPPAPGGPRISDRTPLRPETPPESREEGLFQDVFASDEAPIVRVPARYRRRRRYGWIVGLVLLGLAVVAGGLAYRNREQLGRWASEHGLSLADDTEEAIKEPADRNRTLPSKGPFPRRALAICVNNYLYANPVAYGTADHDVHELLDRLARVLQIPETQVIELSDAARPPTHSNSSSPARRERGQDEGSFKAAARGKKTQTKVENKPVLSPATPRPPLKPIIEKTIADFLASSRPQDRVFLFFMGHVVEIGDDAYLVPLEGELGVKETLIPLAWLYDRLKSCPARQKVLVLDTCRTDPSRGQERPGSGPMGQKLAALVAHPPEGVQIWSACSAVEYSYEMDVNSVFLEKLM